MNNYKPAILAVAVLLLFVHAGFAAKGKKGPHLKSQATVVKQEKAPPASKAPAEPASGEEINWQVISSGGTNASSTSFVLKGTLGQTAVGFGSSTNFDLSHGFWQEFGAATCCNGDGMRGDVDGDASINVADVVWLVDYVFFGGDPPPCEDDPGVFPEADADGDGSVTVGDVVLLVDYVFFGGPPPAPCP